MRLHEQHFELSPASLGDIRQWVRDRCSECGVGDQVDVDVVEIALGEIVQNILRYAYDGSGPVIVRVTDLQEGIGVSVNDFASPSDSKQWAPSKDPTEGGMGLPMIANACDAYSFRALQDGNRASIYFFPNYRHLPFESLLWAGELLDARLAKDSFQQWALWVESDHEPWFSELLSRSIELVEQFETSVEEVPVYHNTDHFRDVLVTVAHLIASQVESNSLSTFERYALIIAAILHDYSHPGSSASYAGQIEEQTINAIKQAQLTSGLGSMASDLLIMILSLIDSTSPRFNLAQATSLQILFNEADVAPSLIPWFGISQAKAIQTEIGDHLDSQRFYENFILSSRVHAVIVSQVVKGWAVHV